MVSLSVRVENLATRMATEFKAVRVVTGALANLTTTDKSSLVSAINELKAQMGAAGAQIDDTAASTTKVYSSSKTDSQIQTAREFARDRQNHIGTQLASTISDFAAAADARITAQKGVANGLASLTGPNGTVPAAQLPSYVDDVLEYNNLAAFPASGETGKIYTALDSGKIYRWSGSAYVEISPSPGSTDAVPEGSTNLYYTNSRAQSANADKAVRANNLSDLANIATARDNLSVYSKAEIGTPDTNFVAVFEAGLQ